MSQHQILVLPLTAACQSKNLALVQYLIKQPSINRIRNYDIDATIRGDTEYFTAFTSKGDWGELLPIAKFKCLW